MLNDLQLLQLEGGDLDFKSSVIAGATPLHIAAANGYLSVVEFLLEHHVSTDVEDDDLWQVRTTVLLRWLVVKWYLIHQKNGTKICDKMVNHQVCKTLPKGREVLRPLSHRESDNCTSR